MSPANTFLESGPSTFLLMAGDELFGDDEPSSLASIPEKNSQRIAILSSVSHRDC